MYILTEGERTKTTRDKTFWAKNTRKKPPEKNPHELRQNPCKDIFMYAYICVYIYAYKYVCMYASIYVCVRVCMYNIVYYTCMNICMRVHNMHENYILTCMYVHKHT